VLEPIDRLRRTATASLNSRRDTDASLCQFDSEFLYGVWVSRRRRPRRRHAEKKRGRAQPPAIVREATRVERLAYTRTQAAHALGISRSTFNRRVLPYIETIEMPWGAKLVPVDELERLIGEGRRPPRERARRSRPLGRPVALPPDVVNRIRVERAAGRSLGQIARDLNASAIPTAHGGRQWWPSTVRAVLVRLGPSQTSPGS
jgi:Recombinase